ncbi:methylated-DNA--[protein]-cysteine S-methyltransferase [Niveibacterium microcysteis]|uniref:Methylated-DNA--protein-cysteine methyltransferase n=1 Tax=Niveibacterium microcysteis TaxID=2811415 RepID=A0ABX7M1L1_9RHOO|nr:methylated-DNA--[protein]-cysteine S-methyltransferase [Niveibacterium microcysteis]QSI75657.1 methylated-DNA--[protein]-cysteine S-methyltransferase [Niveibacterium microcysteis]
MSMIWMPHATPIGAMILAGGPAGLAGAWLVGQAHFDGVQPDWREDATASLLCDAAAQLDEWFAGRRRDFDLPLAPRGTDFQKAVWHEIARVPFGETRNYGSVAQALGKPSAARAVGAAAGRNPLTIIVPCHRLVGCGGALTGYAGGLPRKQTLLAFEAEGTPCAMAA